MPDTIFGKDITDFNYQDHNLENSVTCQDDIQIDHKVSQIPCKHLSHRECLNRWAGEKQECSLCKKKFDILCGKDLSYNAPSPSAPQLPSTSSAPPPLRPIYEIVRDKYRNAPNFFNGLTYNGKQNFMRAIREALTDSEPLPPPPSAPNREKFEDYLTALNELPLPNQRLNFLDSLQEEERYEVLFLLGLSDFSSPSSKTLLSPYTDKLCRLYAKSYEKKIFEKHQAQLSNLIKQLTSSKLFRLKQSLHDQKGVIPLNFYGFEIPFNDFYTLIQRLESKGKIEEFFKSLDEKTCYALLGLLRLSGFSHQDSKDKTQSTLQKLLPDFKKEFPKKIKSLYPSSPYSHYSYVEKQQLLNQLKAITLYGDRFRLNYQASLEKFQDFYQALKLQGQQEGIGFLESLNQELMFEVLYLLRHSCHSTEQSRELTQPLVEKLKTTYANEYAQKILYKYRYNWINLVNNLTIGEQYLIELKDRVLEGVGRVEFHYIGMQEKYQDFVEALSRFSTEWKRMQFLDSLTSIECYEVLALLNYSHLANNKSKNLTKNYLERERLRYARDFSAKIVCRYADFQPMQHLHQEQRPDCRSQYLDKVLFNEGNPLFVMPCMHEQFKDHVALLRKSVVFRDEFFSSLSKDRLAELLFLLHSSQYANPQSRQLVEKQVNIMKKRAIEEMLQTLKEKYKHSQNTSFNSLNAWDRKLLLKAYKDKLFGKNKQKLELLLEDMPAKFNDYKRAFDRIANTQKIKEFLILLPEEEKYEVLMLMRHSPLATASTKAQTNQYVESLKYYWSWGQFFANLNPFQWGS